jgi:CHASE3 domain sensor protein
MNDLLKQRINRMLDAASDERGYQILDYVEFLDSKYAARAEPDNFLSKITATVENTMRAGKLPVQAISGTMSLMDSAAKVMKGLVAAGQAVVDEAVKAAEGSRSEETKAEVKPHPEQNKLSSPRSTRGEL